MPSAVSENVQSCSFQQNGRDRRFSSSFYSSSSFAENEGHGLVNSPVSDAYAKARLSPIEPNRLSHPGLSNTTGEYLTLEGTARSNQEALRESKLFANNYQQNQKEKDGLSLIQSDKLQSILPGGQDTSYEANSFLKEDSNFASSKLPPVKRRRRRYSISSLPVSTVSVFSAFRAQNQNEEKTPKRSTCQLLLNSSIMFGREFCYAVEGGLTTPILLSIGLPLNMYSLVWVVSPVLGFILQPIIGSLSDRCTYKWGKRRPFILVLAILLLIGLTLFLNGEQLVPLFASNETGRRSSTSSATVAAIAVTVTGVVFFDFSADFIEGPVRAYAMDVCNEEDLKKSLLYQAIFTGAGGAFGYASGGVSWIRETPLRRFFPSDRQVVFTASAVIFVFTCIFNLMSIQENQPTRKRLGTEQQTKNKIPKEVIKKVGKQERRTDAHTNDHAGESAEAAVLQVLAKNNRNRLFEEFESNHLLKMDADETSYLYFNANLQKIQPGRKKKLGFKRRKLYKRLDKQKKKRFCKVRAKTNINHQNSDLNLAATYGTFVAKPPQNTSSNELVSVYNPQQLTWPITMFSDLVSTTCETKNRTFDVNHVENWSSDSHSGLNKIPRKFPSGKFKDRSEYDSDLEDSVPANLRVMLEQYFPYAAVDPAFKHLQTNSKNTKVKTDRLSTNSKLPKSNTFDCEEESVFSEAFTAVSGRLSAEEGNEIETAKAVGGVKRLVQSIKTMPKELRFLCICHLLGWVAFLSIALFFTDFVGQVVLKGDPHAPLNSRGMEQYFRGVEIGNWGLTINATVSCVYCGLLKVFIRKLGFRVMYTCGYLAFALGVGLMAMFPTIQVILALSSLIGVMSATLYTIPYMLVAQYHEKYKNLLGTNLERGVGIDCALVTCMIQLAQIITGLGIGGMVNLTGTVTVTAMVASVAGFVGAIWAALLVQY